MVYADRPRRYKLVFKLNFRFSSQQNKTLGRRRRRRRRAVDDFCKENITADL
jgi:hypothetical protein